MGMGQGLRVAGICLLAMAVLAVPARAEPVVESFSVSPSSTQAGAHPDLAATFRVEDLDVPRSPEEATIGFPEGLSGLFGSAILCADSQFALGECPTASQVGLVTVYGEVAGDDGHLLGTAPVFAAVPGEGDLGRFVASTPAPGPQLSMPVALRGGGDLGMDLSIQGFSALVPIARVDLTIWGVPAAPGHDEDRFAPPSGAGCPGVADTSCAGPNSSNAPLAPLLLNPSRCKAALKATISLRVHEVPGDTFLDEASYPQTTGCDQIAFEPDFEAQLSTGEIATRTGLDLELISPQQLSANIPTQSQVRAAGIGLPLGLRLDEEAVEAHAFCTDAQAGLGTEAPPACPAGSEVGSASVETPMLAAPMQGSLYLGESDPQGAARLILAFAGPRFGFKTVMELVADTEEGRVYASFHDLPQVPIERYGISLGASAGLLITPLSCDIYAVSAVVVPWNAELAERVVNHFMTLTSGPNETLCPGPAANVAVVLSPERLPADGESTTMAHATVTDASGVPVLGDAIHFTSSDPGQVVGGTTNNEDGVYYAPDPRVENGRRGDDHGDRPLGQPPRLRHGGSRAARGTDRGPARTAPRVRRRPRR